MRGGLGAAYLFPPLSSGGASIASPCSVSTSRSSNRTCGFPASGSPTAVAFRHTPSTLKLASPEGQACSRIASPFFGGYRLAPLSRPLSPSQACPKSGPFPPPALPGFTGTTSLSATPYGPACPSRVAGWCAPPPFGASRVALDLLVYMLSPLPRRDRWVLALLPSPTTAAFPEIQAGRLPHYLFRGLLSVHCTLRPVYSPSRLATLYTGGFGDFVAYIPAPIATDWSNRCRVGLSPTGDPRLSRRTELIRLSRLKEIKTGVLNSCFLY